MKIQCENCSIEHELDPPAWVVSSGRPFRFRCSSCGHSQMVSASGSRPEPAAAAPPSASPPRPPEEAPTEPRSAAPTPAPAPVSTATPAPAPNAGDAPPIYLKQEGKVYLVRDWATVQRWIMERRVEREDLISEGGVRWEPVGSRPELGSFFAAVEQLEAVEQTGPAASPPPPAPFASSNPFPFGSPEETEDDLGGQVGRFGRLDDDTEGVPMGLPPLPTEETPGPAAAGGADYPDLPPTRGRGRATETLPPPPNLGAVQTIKPSIANDPTLPPQLAAKLPPGITRAHLNAETIPDISPPALATPSPAPRIEKPISQRQTMPIPPDEPEFAMPSETEEIPKERTASLPPEDVFSAYDHADGVTAATEPWEQPRAGMAPWVFVAAAASTALVVVLVVGGYFALRNTGGGEEVAHGPDEGAQLHEVLPSSDTPPTEATAHVDPPPEGGTAEAPPAEATVAATDAGTADAPPVETPPVEAPPEPPATGSATKATQTSAPKPQSVSSLVDKGWGAVDKGKLDSAASTFKQAVTQNPEHADANFGYGYVLLKQGQKDLAKKHLCRALQNAGPSSEVGREANGMLQTNGMSCG